MRHHGDNDFFGTNNIIKYPPTLAMLQRTHDIQSARERHALKSTPMSHWKRKKKHHP